MGTPSQAEILAKIEGAATLPATTSDDELKVEDDVESTDATEDATGTEDVEQEDTDTDDETDTQDESESADEDEGNFLDYTLSGQAHRVDLRNPDDIARVRKALEKEGLEVTAQRHAEARKRAEAELEATRVKVSEYEMLAEQRKSLDPYMRLLENPQTRDQIGKAYKLPRVDYDPRLAAERVRNAQLEKAQLNTSNQQAIGELERSILAETEMTGEQLLQCVEYLNGKRLGWDLDRPITEQADSIRGLVGMARQALMAEGKLPNPAVQRLERDKAESERKLRSAKKRAKARNPSPGTGATGSKSGRPLTDLAGADIEAVVAEFKRRAGK